MTTELNKNIKTMQKLSVGQTRIKKLTVTISNDTS